MNVIGDARKMATTIVDARASELDAKLDSALSAARKLLDSALLEAMTRTRNAIESKALEASERLRSAEAEADLKVKLRADQLRARYIDEVFSEVRRRLATDRGDWYRSYLERAISAVAQEASKGVKFTLLCRKDDIELLRELASKYGFEVAEGSTDIIGGFVALSEDSSMRIDLTIDQLLAENEVTLRGLISRKLFGDA